MLRKKSESSKQKGREVTNNFVFPAVLYPANEEMRVYKEEQFGPVIPVISFDKIDVPISFMAGSNYGQQVSLFGKSEKIGSID